MAAIDSGRPLWMTAIAILLAAVIPAACGLGSAAGGPGAPGLRADSALSLEEAVGAQMVRLFSAILKGASLESHQQVDLQRRSLPQVLKMVKSPTVGPNS